MIQVLEKSSLEKKGNDVKDAKQQNNESIFTDI